MFCSIKRSTFRGLSEVLCWLNLGLCVYYGYVIGNAMGQPAIPSGWGRQAVAAIPGRPLEGLLIGALIGLITSAIYGGFVAALLRIDEKCENGSPLLSKVAKRVDNMENQILSKIAKQVDNLEYQLCEGSSTSSNYTSVVNEEPSNVESGGTSWWCKECGKKNTSASTKCEYCNG